MKKLEKNRNKRWEPSYQQRSRRKSRHKIDRNGVGWIQGERTIGRHVLGVDWMSSARSGVLDAFARIGKWAPVRVRAGV